MHYS
jgi:retron-type reverse transcriptase